MSTLRFIRYMEPFHDPVMYQIKFELSSPKGQRSFINKVTQYMEIMKNGGIPWLIQLDNAYRKEEQ